MDPARWGECRWDMFRWGVRNDVWERLVRRVEADGSSADVTRRTLSLGARSATTGWRAKSYAESTIEMVIFERGSTPTALPPGTYVRTDALGLCAAGVVEGDEIQDAAGRYWEVHAVRDHTRLDDFLYREADLTRLPLHT